MNTRTLAAAALLLAASCYRPDLSKVKYVCSAELPVCPDGQSCIGGCCGGPPCGELASADGGAQDPPPWDPQARPSATPACRSGTGYLLAPNAVACPAVLSAPGDITSMCGAGWELCPLNPLPVERCSSVPWGFFVGASHGMQFHVPPGQDMKCFWSGAGADANQRFLFGCGSTPKTSYDSPVPCGGFDRAVLCRNGAAEAPTTWDCLLGAAPGDADFANTVQSNAQDGVLCCG